MDQSCPALLVPSEHQGYWCSYPNFQNINGIDSCWAACDGNCREVYGFSSIEDNHGFMCASRTWLCANSYLCQKCPTYNVPRPVEVDNTGAWCDKRDIYTGSDGIKYCWGTCDGQCPKDSNLLMDCGYHRCQNGSKSYLCRKK